MKRVIAVLAVAVFAFAAFAAVERTLTPEEEAGVNTYLTARSAYWSQTKLNSEMNQRIRRRPGVLCREYERYKMNYPNWKPGDPSQRWLQRPKFPGWDDPCYTWYPDGKTYLVQLKCSKCGYLTNPSGSDCERNHPLPLMDQWRFTVRLIATDHKKPMEAKAHVWNAHEHGELTDAQFDELMGIIDGIPAE